MCWENSPHLRRCEGVTVCGCEGVTMCEGVRV